MAGRLAVATVEKVVTGLCIEEDTKDRRDIVVFRVSMSGLDAIDVVFCAGAFGVGIGAAAALGVDPTAFGITGAEIWPVGPGNMLPKTIS
ncbi:hypothetical protein RSAG8_09983, partial [Rhizoctonia solani AG-8 WAC10335]